MLGRAELETVPLQALEPIYFAKSAQEMAGVLGQLEAGVGLLAGGRVARVELPNAAAGTGFVRVPGEMPVQSFETFVSESDTASSFVIQAGEAPRRVLLD